MADANHSPPPLDTVLLWLTNTVERDWASRGVFPAFRTPTAVCCRSSSSLHLLTIAEAERVMADATTRLHAIDRGLKVAYNGLLANCEWAIEQARERTTAFAGPEAHCTDQDTTTNECWRGTKAQLSTKGVDCPGPWPGEPGAKRWSKAKDWRGYDTYVTRYSPLWPGLYQARVSIPYEVWSAASRSTQSKEAGAVAAKRAAIELAYMPRSMDDYRAKLVADLRRMVKIPLDMAGEPKFHGYYLDDDSAAAIHQAFDAVAEAIVVARVHFDSARHAEIKQGHRAAIAAADVSFQTKVADLVRPNTRILEERSR